MIHEKAKNGAEVASIFIAAAGTAPELDIFGVQTIDGNSYKRKFQVSGAEVTNDRDLYNGVDASNGVYESEVMNTGIASTNINIDKADLNSVGDIEAQTDFMTSELKGGAANWKRGLGHNIFYNKYDESTKKGWDGLQEKVDAGHLLKLTTSTTTNHSSIYLVYTGQNGNAYAKGCRIFLGGGGVIDNPDWDNTGFNDSEGRKVPGVSTSIEGYPCVSRGDAGAIVRYANIGTAAGKTATDAICAEMIDKLPEEFRADLANCYFFMSHRSVSQIRDSRQATNQTGAPAPYPAESFGVKIIATGSIKDTEPKQV